MKFRLLTALFVLAAGCGGTAAPGTAGDPTTEEKDLTGGQVSRAPEEPVEENETVPVTPKPNAITSTADGDLGETYVAGTFSGTFELAGTRLVSRGGRDVFVARFEPDGSLGWARSVGSFADDLGPKVVFDGTVKVIATTTGEVDCGDGPLAAFDTKMFFLCFFDPQGGTAGGGAFPIAGQ